VLLMYDGLIVADGPTMADDRLLDAHGRERP
jgi:hypothetical protein